MRFLKNLAVAAVLLPVLGACAYVDLEEIGNMEVQNWEFAQALHQEYVALAKAEADEQDWDDANYFGNKAIAAVEAANEGATVPEPQAVSERDLPGYTVADLAGARTYLMMALDEGRRTKPQHAARAQAMFDCWIQEQEENVQPEDIATCRKYFDIAFKGLMKKKVAAAPAPAAPAPTGQAVKAVGPFIVYFGFNSAKLDSAANALIGSLSGHDFAGDELGYIVLSGHTDRAGNQAYNEALADKRVTAVADAFRAKGIQARILSSSYGEDRPMKSTDDGTREPTNRRVEITLSR